MCICDQLVAAGGRVVVRGPALQSFLSAASMSRSACCRLADVPPTAYPNQIAVARVRLGGGNCMKKQQQGPDDRHAAGRVAPLLDNLT